MPAQNKIGVRLLTMETWCREALAGIADYAAQFTDWQLVELNAERSPDADKLGPPHFCAHIGVFPRTSAPVWHQLLQRRLALVNLTNWQPATGVQTIFHDHAAIGRLAAEHLVALKLRHFAGFGDRASDFTQPRLEGFYDGLRRSGFEMPQERLDDMANLALRDLEAWLQALPKPVGIFAANDYAARRFFECCTHARLDVPQEVSLIGADNDPRHCAFCPVPLSSVVLDFFQLGFEGARMLHRMLLGLPLVRPSPIRPIGISVRASTGFSSIADPLVRQAMARIARHPHGEELLTVSRLLEGLGVSRRTLERTFLAAIGETPKSVIQRTRLERARILLRDPHRRVIDVALALGFKDQKRFARLFREQFGLTPRAFRHDAIVSPSRRPASQGYRTLL